MTTSTDKRSPDECIENASTGVTRESFEKAFREFGPAQPLLALIDKNAMDQLFTIADEHLRYDISVRAMDRRSMGQDYGRWEKLLSGAERRLEELEEFVKGFIQPQSPRASSEARAMLTQTRAFKRSLDRLFFGVEYRVRARRDQVLMLSVKSSVYEFTLDLDAFIRNRFPELKTKDREALLAAAMAGAGMYTKTELQDSSGVARMPMQVSRANKYYKQTYSDRGVGRVYSYLGAGKKVKKKQNQETLRNLRTRP